MRITYLIIILVLITSSVFAQPTTLRGQVTDESGALVPGAKVTLQPADGAPKTAIADGQGRYSFAPLPSGNYTVSATAPDLSTPQAFKAALLAARSLSYSDPKAGGSAAAYFATLLERLGIAHDVNAKATLGRNGHHVAELVADGTAELGISFLSELVAIKGVTIAGPLPAELQNHTVYAAAVALASREREAARALMAWIRRPEADAAWRAAGLEPSGR